MTGLLTILGFSLYDTVVVFDKVRENTKNLRASRMSYAEAANLAVNQTLVRSINTSIVALIPVGAILYVGAVQLGAGSLKDLALALFVGMAAGAYSSIFIATPLLADMKSREAANQALEKRLATKRRHEADRYASVPVFKDDLPGAGRPGRRTAGRRPGRGPRGRRLGPEAVATGPDRPRARRTPGSTSRHPEQCGRTAAAHPAVSVQAGQEVIRRA